MFRNSHKQPSFYRIRCLMEGGCYTSNNLTPLLLQNKRCTKDISAEIGFSRGAAAACRACPAKCQSLCLNLIRRPLRTPLPTNSRYNGLARIADLYVPEEGGETVAVINPWWNKTMFLNLNITNNTGTFHFTFHPAQWCSSLLKLLCKHFLFCMSLSAVSSVPLVSVQRICVALKLVHRFW